MKLSWTASASGSPTSYRIYRGTKSDGEVNTPVQLTAGLHYVEYYHEEVTLEQMAFLGWRPSADAGRRCSLRHQGKGERWIS